MMGGNKNKIGELAQELYQAVQNSEFSRAKGIIERTPAALRKANELYENGITSIAIGKAISEISVTSLHGLPGRVNTHGKLMKAKSKHLQQLKDIGYKHLDFIESLVDEQGMNVDIPHPLDEKKRTPLQMAVAGQVNTKPIVEWLVEKGADVTKKNRSEGKSALDYAASNYLAPGLFEYLLKFTAGEPRCLLVDEYGQKTDFAKGLEKNACGDNIHILEERINRERGPKDEKVRVENAEAELRRQNIKLGLQARKNKCIQQESLEEIQQARKDLAAQRQEDVESKIKEAESKIEEAEKANKQLEKERAFSPKKTIEAALLLSGNILTLIGAFSFLRLQEASSEDKTRDLGIGRAEVLIGAALVSTIPNATTFISEITNVKAVRDCKDQLRERSKFLEYLISEPPTKHNIEELRGSLELRQNKIESAYEDLERGIPTANTLTDAVGNRRSQGFLQQSEAGSSAEHAAQGGRGY